MTATASTQKSQELFLKAQELMPGGVNSPVRAFKSVGTTPRFIAKAKGAYTWDEDGNKYIDYVGSWGPMLHGHADADIEKALLEVLPNGTSFGAPTALENEMAAEVIKLVPSIEMVRFVNSGTEAVMSAIRLARAYATRHGATNKTKIIKFTGCYHGHADALLVQAGSGVATLGLPDSPGVVKASTQDTLLVPYNDIEALQEVLRAYPLEIAAIILEPVVGNSGCIPPLPGYLEALRHICDKHDALLIFDEVMTGFRLAPGGAQEYYNITPDLTTLGKVIGGGLPVGAYGGRKDIMEMVAPAGPMYQAGTLSGNPLAMTAGLTSLRKLQADGFYEDLAEKTAYLVNGLKEASKSSSQPAIAKAQFAHVPAMFGMFFSEEPVHNYETAKNMNLDLFSKYYQAMLAEGIYLAPSAFEAGFLSAAHSYEDLDATITAHKKVVSNL